MNCSKLFIYVCIDSDKIDICIFSKGISNIHTAVARSLT